MPPMTQRHREPSHFTVHCSVFTLKRLISRPVRRDLPIRKDNFSQGGNGSSFWVQSRFLCIRPVRPISQSARKPPSEKSILPRVAPASPVRLLKMESPVSWEEIDLSESYLVSCMFEEAASLSYSTLQRLRELAFENPIDEVVEDMIECSGAVWIQACKALGRTHAILKELPSIFGSVLSIPAPLLLTWACMIIAENCLSGLQEVLEEFLHGWRHAEEKPYNILRSIGQHQISLERYLSEENYELIMRVYAISLLGVALDNVELARQWLVKAELPQEKKQELLQELQYICRPKIPDSLPPPGKTKSLKQEDVATSITEPPPSYAKEAKGSEAIPLTTDEKNPDLKYSSSQHCARGRLVKAVHSFLFFFRAFALKLGHAKIILGGTFIFAILYILRKKRHDLKRLAAMQLSSLRRVAVDAWQLAFSMQVNPLAVIQPPPAVAHGPI